jgi:hypothetical protein
MGDGDDKKSDGTITFHHDAGVGRTEIYSATPWQQNMLERQEAITGRLTKIEEANNAMARERHVVVLFLVAALLVSVAFAAFTLHWIMINHFPSQLLQALANCRANGAIVFP